MDRNEDASRIVAWSKQMVVKILLSELIEMTHGDFPCDGCELHDAMSAIKKWEHENLKGVDNLES